MAKKSIGTEEEIMLTMPRPRLTKLIVKNFRCIGQKGVEIDLDEIVILEKTVKLTTQFQFKLTTCFG